VPKQPFSRQFRIQQLVGPVAAVRVPVEALTTDASCSQALKEKKNGDALYYVMTQAQSIYTLCNYGVVYTRIQSMGRKRKERRRKKAMYMGKDSNGRR